MTGPWVVSLKLTGPAGGPAPGLNVPASKSVMSRQSPRYRYLVSLPSHSSSTNWSMRSDPDEVALHEKSGPRPSSTYGPEPGNDAPRASTPGACTSYSNSRPG